ncbi:MAG: hypothetical protein HN341_01865 [Verrucomicrobia bacterium]|jgi:hypothetical protein|nr:hypothetical protein [Verrucomicrobiota bacterium]
MLDALLFASAVNRAATKNQSSLAGKQASRVATDVRHQTEYIKSDVEKLFMITEALWTILKEQHGYTEDDLIARVEAIDMRDGVLDGRVAKSAVKPDCPECGRKLMGRRPVCLYCGTEVILDPFSR